MFKRIASRTAVTLVLALAGAGLTAAPSSAATCSGSGCEGKDPQKYGCSGDAKTVGEITVGGVYVVQLRRSAKCKAEWSRTTNDPNYALPGNQVQSWTYVNVPPIHSKRKTYYSGDHQWTPMVQSKYDSRACMWSTAVDGPLECTGFH